MRVKQLVTRAPKEDFSELLEQLTHKTETKPTVQKTPRDSNKASPKKAELPENLASYVSKQKG